jgi:hypothetical protein
MENGVCRRDGKGICGWREDWAVCSRICGIGAVVERYT